MSLVYISSTGFSAQKSGGFCGSLSEPLVIRAGYADRLEEPISPAYAEVTAAKRRIQSFWRDKFALIQSVLTGSRRIFF